MGSTVFNIIGRAMWWSLQEKWKTSLWLLITFTSVLRFWNLKWHLHNLQLLTGQDNSHSIIQRSALFVPTTAPNSLYEIALCNVAHEWTQLVTSTGWRMLCTLQAQSSLLRIGKFPRHGADPVRLVWWAPAVLVLFWSGTM